MTQQCRWLSQRWCHFYWGTYGGCWFTTPATEKQLNNLASSLQSGSCLGRSPQALNEFQSYLVGSFKWLFCLLERELKEILLGENLLFNCQLKVTRSVCPTTKMWVAMNVQCKLKKKKKNLILLIATDDFHPSPYKELVGNTETYPQLLGVSEGVLVTSYWVTLVPKQSLSLVCFFFFLNSCLVSRLLSHFSWRDARNSAWFFVCLFFSFSFFFF